MADQRRPDKAQTIAVAGLLLLASSPSYAYLDPGTGSIILQSVLAGVAVAIGFLRFYWHRFKAFLSSLTGSGAKTAAEDEQDLARESETGNTP